MCNPPQGVIPCTKMYEVKTMRGRAGSADLLWRLHQRVADETHHSFIHPIPSSYLGTNIDSSRILWQLHPIGIRPGSFGPSGSIYPWLLPHRIMPLTSMVTPTTTMSIVKFLPRFMYPSHRHRSKTKSPENPSKSVQYHIYVPPNRDYFSHESPITVGCCFTPPCIWPQTCDLVGQSAYSVHVHQLLFMLDVETKAPSFLGGPRSEGVVPSLPGSWARFCCAHWAWRSSSVSVVVGFFFLALSRLPRR